MLKYSYKGYFVVAKSLLQELGSQPPHSKLWGRKEPNPTRGERREVIRIAEVLGLVKDIINELEGELGTTSLTRVSAQFAATRMFIKLKEKYELKEASPNSEPLSSPQQAEGYPAEGQ